MESLTPFLILSLWCIMTWYIIDILESNSDMIKQLINYLKSEYIEIVINQYR